MTAHPENQTEIILDSIADGVFTVDKQWRITSFNRAAEKITGIGREEAVGRYCWDVFRASICESRCSLRQTMDTGEPLFNQSVFIVNSKGERLPISISTALLEDEKGEVIGGVETFRDLSVVEELKKELYEKHTFFDIISKNKEMQRLFGILEQVAHSDSTVLLVGESGTGKELFARAIHSLSPRKNGPLVPINCGALPDNLLESELFGYKSGAFTDAKRDKLGRLAIAEGGTLFLDEIGDVSPALQARLLRFLQDKVFEPLGGTHPEHADVRIVAATNKDIERLVAEGSFRQDLYYRINVIKLVLPALRERREDIPLLSEHFIRKFSRLSGREIQGFSSEVLTILMSHEFPGNIRELENIIEYATVVCKTGIVGVRDLPDYLCPINEENGAVKKGGEAQEASWAELERNYIIEVLESNNWKRSSAAAQLGIHPSTLWRKMKRLDIADPGRSKRKKE
ncbi:sigma-54 interaction domain-containing protein [Thermodesulfobacteriota bacterium]